MAKLQYLRAMLNKLQKRWGISAWRVVLVLCTFAIGGSLSGWSARKLMPLLELEKGVAFWAVYLVLVTLIWPVAVLIISVFFGQFAFFKSYLARMARRMGFSKKTHTSKKSLKNKSLKFD